MKHVISIVVERKSTERIEVEFPVFRRFDCLGDDYSSIYYSRLDADGTKYQIHKWEQCGGDRSFEVTVEKRPLESMGEYISCKGIHYEAITRDVFEQKLVEVRAYLASFDLHAEPT